MFKKFIVLILIFFHCSNIFAQDIRLGTTFSPTQTEYLKLDWKNAYKAILGLGFDYIRLCAYWNVIESKKDQFDWAALDWQIQQAKEKGVPIILTIGIKGLRWPEYFIPAWLEKDLRFGFGADIAQNSYLRQRAQIFITEVVNRYRNENIIKIWQVENEPLNRIGVKFWYIGPNFIKDEIALVRSLDRCNRPILLTIATYPKAFLRFLSRLFFRHDPLSESLKLCDILGINIYPVVGHKFWWMDLYFWTTQSERSRYFSQVLKIAQRQSKQVWVMELQAEPWEPGQLVYIGKKTPFTGRTEILNNVFPEIQELGFDTIFLWGAEYWYFRDIRHNDKSWWNTIINLLSKIKHERKMD